MEKKKKLTVGLEPTTSGLEVQCAIQLRHASSTRHTSASSLPYMKTSVCQTNTTQVPLVGCDGNGRLTVRTVPIERVKGLLRCRVGAHHVQKTRVVEHAPALLVRAALVREEGLPVVLQLVSTREQTRKTARVANRALDFVLTDRRLGGLGERDLKQCFNVDAWNHVHPPSTHTTPAIAPVSNVGIHLPFKLLLLRRRSNQ